MMPPARLSVGDRGWRRYAGRIRVFLDGAEIQRCTAYDAESGWVRLQKVDGHGRVIRSLNSFAQETLQGRVEVTWK